MTKELADALKAAADDLNVMCSVREGYSGRGMYGKDTIALVIPDARALARLTAAAGAALVRKQVATGLAGEKFTDTELVRQLDTLRQDSMGLDIVVY